MYCTCTSRDRSQRPLVVTKLPLPPEPAWKSPISNRWETLGSCHPSLCYYVNLGILTLGYYEIEVWWNLIDSNEPWLGLSAQAEGVKSMWAVQYHQFTMNQIYFKPDSYNIIQVAATWCVCCSGNGHCKTMTGLRSDRKPEVIKNQ